MNTLIDGEAMSSVPVDERALLYGESLFETIGFHGDRAPLWDGHMARLKKGAQLFGWEAPDEELLANECARLLSSWAAPKAVIRITLTGGSGGHGYWPPSVQSNRRIVQIRPWPEHIERQQERGLRCIVSPFRLPLQWECSGLKHGSRLLQIRAASHCRSRGADEALLLDQQDCFAEGLSSNLILVVNGQLLTPRQPDVEGVGLAWLKKRLGAELQSGTVAVGNMELLDEVLVINSVGGIRPVIAIDNHPLPCGPVARKLQSIWCKELLLCD
jgi:4-amino-4-deoxychorismate lyase